MTNFECVHHLILVLVPFHFIYKFFRLKSIFFYALFYLYRSMVFYVETEWIAMKIKSESKSFNVWFWMKKKNKKICLKKKDIFVTLILILFCFLFCYMSSQCTTFCLFIYCLYFCLFYTKNVQIIHVFLIPYHSIRHF